MRRIADLGRHFVTALEADGDAQRPLVPGSQGIRQRGRELVVVDFHITQIFVVLFLALGQLQCTQLQRIIQCSGGNAPTVQIVVVGDFPCS